MCAGSPVCVGRGAFVYVGCCMCLRIVCVLWDSVCVCGVCGAGVCVCGVHVCLCGVGVCLVWCV